MNDSTPEITEERDALALVNVELTDAVRGVLHMAREDKPAAWVGHQALVVLLLDESLDNAEPSATFVAEHEARVWEDVAKFVDGEREDFDGDLRQVRDRIKHQAKEIRNG
jgi:hypothetical protein